MSYHLQCELKNIKSGVDKYEQPVVDIHLRTKDFTAMTLAKYIARQEPVDIKVVE
jgi:hypothetical protein